MNRSPSFFTILRRDLLFPIEKKEYQNVLITLSLYIVPILVFWLYKTSVISIETVSLILFFSVFRENRNENLVFISNSVLMCGYFYLFESTPWFLVIHQLIYFTAQVFRSKKPNLSFYLHATFFYLILLNLEGPFFIAGAVFILYPIVLIILGTLMKTTPSFSREKNENYRWLLLLIVFYMEAIQV